MLISRGRTGPHHQDKKRREAMNKETTTEQRPTDERGPQEIIVDTEIEPLIDQIREICKRSGMAFAVIVGYDEDRDNPDKGGHMGGAYFSDSLDHGTEMRVICSLVVKVLGE